MHLTPIMQCASDLDFSPHAQWPAALPAVAWRGYLLCGFERLAQPSAVALALTLADDTDLVEALKACYPRLGLAEAARLLNALEKNIPQAHREFSAAIVNAYGWRADDRLTQILALLLEMPKEFQDWCDAKGLAARDLSPLLALPQPAEFKPFARGLAETTISKSEGTRALELGVELFLLGSPLNDLLPYDENTGAYLRRLERWRRPQTAQFDEQWRSDVAKWPWPAHVQAEWQRFGDQAGLEIKIRTTSPQDFMRKLERLDSIRETWSCKI